MSTKYQIPAHILEAGRQAGRRRLAILTKANLVSVILGEKPLADALAEHDRRIPEAKAAAK